MKDLGILIILKGGGPIQLNQFGDHLLKCAGYLTLQFVFALMQHQGSKLTEQVANLPPENPVCHLFKSM